MLLQKFIFIIFNDLVQKEVNWPHLKKKKELKRVLLLQYESLCTNLVKEKLREPIC